ncbi:MAG: single-stranded DNA-binding protein, partial [Planctomycetota bacterium]
EGSLRLDQWDDKQSGEKRSKLYVVGDDWQFVGAGERGAMGGGGGGRDMGGSDEGSGGYGGYSGASSGGGGGGGGGGNDAGPIDVDDTPF